MEEHRTENGAKSSLIIPTFATAAAAAAAAAATVQSTQSSFLNGLFLLHAELYFPFSKQFVFLPCLKSFNALFSPPWCARPVCTQPYTTRRFCAKT